MPDSRFFDFNILDGVGVLFDKKNNEMEYLTNIHFSDSPEKIVSKLNKKFDVK